MPDHHIYMRYIEANDDTCVTVGVKDGQIRLSTDDYYARRAYLTPQQAAQLRDALDEALWLTEIVYDGAYQKTAAEIAAAMTR